MTCLINWRATFMKPKSVAWVHGAFRTEPMREGRQGRGTGAWRRHGAERPEEDEARGEEEETRRRRRRRRRVERYHRRRLVLICVDPGSPHSLT
ncbi:hypothetical protein PVAP13_3KG332127 [Panicum virgatum]|uniref:Uncharacterized protein n=1 Tax=Panicum virgatum TaxID=38727 RepID=A0A8T0UVG0_PANVG|nr:hypothetical protein PVAP13_3KG332127 [Panicum virgatum]